MPRNRRSASLPQSARSVALSVLVESATSEEGVDALLDRELSSGALDGRDRALAMELAYGVLRRQGTIDWRLGFVLDKPLHRLPVLVQMLLRVGAYQIMFLERIPQSAAVNESVNLAKANSRVLGRDWSGLVNAVLRSLIRESSPPWPSDPVDALAARCSVPEWLSRRWIDRLGLEKAEQACEQTCSIPPLTIRVNRLKTTRENFLAQLHQAGIAAEATAISPAGVIIQGSGSVPELPGFAEGYFYVEDEAAQLIPLILSPRQGEVILDACAAPGGKATQLAELMGDQGAVYAIDRKGVRLDLLRSNCARLGIKSIIPLVGDVRDPSAWLGAVQSEPDNRLESGRPFDRILVDAPCSGLGVLRRHPEAKWRKEGASLERHHRLQLQILEAVAPRLRPGGVLVYSTCSTEPEENESVIEEFCRIHAGFRREAIAPWLPAEGREFLTERGDLCTMGNRHSMDGFYAARLTTVT